MDDLSSSQYAFRSNICLQYYFYSDDDDYDEVYYDFESKGNQLVAYKFKNHIHSLDCFPLKFSKQPKYSQLNFFLERMCYNLGFLNKHKNTNHLLRYIEIVIYNKYYMYNYNIDHRKYKQQIKKGKTMELEEMNFTTRKYMFLDEYKNLSKDMKIKIMNTDRYENLVTETTQVVLKAVTDLLSNYGDFIHNELIAEKTKLPLSTVQKYTEVHRDRINKHNKKNYGTDNYNEYQHECNIRDIKYEIMNAKIENTKPSIKQISEKLKLHRNTVSRLIKENQLM